MEQLEQIKLILKDKTININDSKIKQLLLSLIEELENQDLDI